MNYKIYNNLYKINYTHSYNYSLIDKTVIVQNLDNKFRLNGQIGKIKKCYKNNYFVIKLNSYISLKSIKPTFLKLHHNNFEIIH